MKAIYSLHRSIKAQHFAAWVASVACVLLLFFGCLGQAYAHKASDAYLILRETPAAAGGLPVVSMRLSVALKDVDAALDFLDADNDRRLTWGEIRQAIPGIVQWASKDVLFQCAGHPLTIAWTFETLEQRSDGAYVRFGAPLSCPSTASISLDYKLLRDVDPTHRLLLNGTLDDKPFATVLSPLDRSTIELRQSAKTVAGQAASTTSGMTAQVGQSSQSGQAARQLPQTGLATLKQFFDEGVHHILTGYDHLAFLLALLLPVVLFRKAQYRPAVSATPADVAVQPRRQGFSALLLTVTGFTVGHSLTLMLATLVKFSVSPAWVEPAIALTIAFSAALNLYPMHRLRGDVLALVFGMIHGLAFSTVMTEAGISGSLLLWGLAGFNLGVEAGQLVVVAIWCVIHRVLIPWRFYDLVVIRGGSLALLVLALYWTVQRILTYTLI